MQDILGYACRPLNRRLGLGHMLIVYWQKYCHTNNCELRALDMGQDRSRLQVHLDIGIRILTGHSGRYRITDIGSGWL